MIMLTASKRFQQERADAINKVNSKLDEFVAGLGQAMTMKFAAKYETELLPLMEHVVLIGSSNKADAEKVTELLKMLEILGNNSTFAPFAKTQLVRAVGDKRLPKVESIVVDNWSFYASFKAALPLVVQVLENPTGLAPNSLMNPALVPRQKLGMGTGVG